MHKQATLGLARARVVGAALHRPGRRARDLAGQHDHAVRGDVRRIGAGAVHVAARVDANVQVDARQARDCPATQFLLGDIRQHLGDRVVSQQVADHVASDQQRVGSEAAVRLD